ncbi:exported hypothetical protein [Mesorhizobium sp. STM 4661]|nr:exported hypothetical protein [Mesorhizobium sp. STM 4661]
MKIIVHSLLASFLIVLETLVVAQGRWRHIAAGTDAGAEGVVPDLMRMSCGMGPPHGCPWIAARAVAVSRGSIAGLTVLCNLRAIKVP